MALSAATMPRWRPAPPLTDDEVSPILDEEVKSRRESIDAYEKAGREDLAAKERRRSRSSRNSCRSRSTRTSSRPRARRDRRDRRGHPARPRQGDGLPLAAHEEPCRRQGRPSSSPSGRRRRTGRTRVACRGGRSGLGARATATPLHPLHAARCGSPRHRRAVLVAGMTAILSIEIVPAPSARSRRDIADRRHRRARDRVDYISDDRTDAAAAGGAQQRRPAVRLHDREGARRSPSARVSAFDTPWSPVDAAFAARSTRPTRARPLAQALAEPQRREPRHPPGTARRGGGPTCGTEMARVLDSAQRAEVRDSDARRRRAQLSSSSRRASPPISGRSRPRSSPRSWSRTRPTTPTLTQQAKGRCRGRVEPVAQRHQGRGGRPRGRAHRRRSTNGCRRST